jgi:hypothetical protein
MNYYDELTTTKKMTMSHPDGWMVTIELSNGEIIIRDDERQEDDSYNTVQEYKISTEFVDKLCAALKSMV